MKHPKAVYLLTAVQMWERFSFYGMRVLLLLFLIDQLKLDDSYAYAIFATYAASIELGAVVGGRIADRFLGARRAIVAGALIIASGHLILAFHSSQALFFLGLSTIVVGSGFFSTNIRALLGSCYPKGYAGQESGFTLFYAGINFGGFLATLLCVAVAASYGYSMGFGLAAGGMFLGILLLLAGRKMLNEIAPPFPYSPKASHLVLILASVIIVAVAIANPTLSTQVIPVISLLGILSVARRCIKNEAFDRTQLQRLGKLLFLFVLFFAVEELTGSMCLLFLSRHCEPILFGYAINPPSLIVVNPVAIVVLGPLFATQRFLPSFDRRLMIATLCLFAAFGILGKLALNNSGTISPLVIIVSFTLIAIAEVLIIPSILSYTARVTPQNMKAEMMGGVMMGHSIASILSGYICRLFAFTTEELSHLSSAEAMERYGEGFLIIALSALFILILLPSLRLRSE